MKKEKRTVWTNREMIVVLVLLVVSLAGNVAQQIYIRIHLENPNAVGTYLSGPQENPGVEYFVLESNGGYMIYIQGEILDEGKYVEEEEGKYLLTSKRTDKSFPILISGKKIYQFQDEKTIAVYEKFRDLPIYINVDNGTMDNE